jgi:lipopolysaccharide/colanic/teichoic acid biosynthesis glycosyltransferase
MDFSLDLFFPAHRELMGIIRDTIKPAIDVRIERVRYLQVLQESKIQKRSLETVGSTVYDILHRVLASAFLIAASPILVIVAIAIKIDSPGPLFFRQERMGRYGRIFEIIKFRTMVHDAEKHTGPVLASRNDTRMTRVGRVIRHYRIDEIPQMLNVVSGNMALVGPRPERPEIYDGIVQDWPEFFKRLEVKPGITGLAQIRGDYHTNPRDKLRYDLLYIRKRSPIVDARIIASTAYICLLCKGAC